jgi:hypothetical protein
MVGVRKLGEELFGKKREKDLGYPRSQNCEEIDPPS